MLTCIFLNQNCE